MPLTARRLRSRRPVEVDLAGHDVRLRRPRLSDAAAWRDARLRSRRSIEPFWQDVNLSWEERHTHRLWVRACLDGHRAAVAGRAASWVVEVDGVLAGQVDLASIGRPPGSAELGIWVDDRVSGSGVAGAAVTRVLRIAFDELGLERVTAPVAPSNHAMEHLLDQLGFTAEALMRGFLRTGRGRRDHTLWVIGSEDSRSAAPAGHRPSPRGRPPRILRVRRGPGAGPARDGVEVLRYVASWARATVRRRRAPGDRDEGQVVWRTGSGPASVDVVRVEDVDPLNQSVEVVVTEAGAGLGTAALAEVVASVVRTLTHERDAVRVETRVPAAWASDGVPEALGRAGFAHEGRTRTSRGPHDLWAHVR